MTIPTALESFALPDLHGAIIGRLHHCSNGEPHNVAGQRPARSRLILPMEKLQIWSKV